MAVKMFWEGLRERAEKLRRSASDLKAKAGERADRLGELALAAQEQRDGGRKAFDEAVAEADRLLAEARVAEFAAAELDKRAEDTRREDIDAQRAVRVAEMSDARAAYNHAINEMDRALADVEDAHVVLRDARNDYVASLRGAEFTDAASSLQRRASQMLQATVWANAPGVARALGIELRHRHNAKNMADAVGFLPEPQKQEQ